MTGKRAARLAPARAHLSRADPVLGELIAARPGFDPRAWLAELPKMDAFGVLIFQIAGQQLSVAATRRILGRLQERFAGRLPSPTQLLAADPDILRTAGLSRRKVQTLRSLATEFVEDRLSEKSLRAMSDAQIEARLTALPGIGRWTVQGFLIIALNRDDVVLPGDLALRKAIQRSYGLDRLPTQDEVLAIAEPWRPYRSLATSYLFATAYEAPERAGAR